MEFRKMQLLLRDGTKERLKQAIALRKT
jgi:hypothetical protein